MHYLAYVLLPKSAAKTSLEARRKVADELAQDHSFCCDYTPRYSTPICDWFQVGGRFTGAVYPHDIRMKFYEAAETLASKTNENAHDDHFIKANRKKLDSIWKELGGKGKSPLTREQDFGAEDDACILDRGLADMLNQFLFDKDGYGNYETSICRRWQASGELLPEPIVIFIDELYVDDLNDFNELVGKYWVVVVDYHM